MGSRRELPFSPLITGNYRGGGVGVGLKRQPFRCSRGGDSRHPDVWLRAEIADKQAQVAS